MGKVKKGRLLIDLPIPIIGQKKASNHYINHVFILVWLDRLLSCGF